MDQVELLVSQHFLEGKINCLLSDLEWLQTVTVDLIMVDLTMVDLTMVDLHITGKLDNIQL